MNPVLTPVPVARPARSLALSRPLLSPSGPLRSGNRAFLVRWEERRQAVRRALLPVRVEAAG